LRQVPWIGFKVITLRYAASCSNCSIRLQAGVHGRWNSVNKSITCMSCNSGAERILPVITPDENSSQKLERRADGLETTRTGESGVAGRSARREYERRQAKQTNRIESVWGTGLMGRIVKAIAGEPSSTSAWSKGASGEERVAEVLHQHLGSRAVLLHDRRVPRTRGNIDHIVVASSGVWIIDAKRYSGEVRRRDVGGWFKTDMRLYVGRRDCSKAIAGMQWQLDAVTEALGQRQDIPVHTCLSFVGAEWPLFFAKPFMIENVWVSWPTKLVELVAQPGSLSVEEIERVGDLLARRLPVHE